jgi:hypothetical protein
LTGFQSIGYDLFDNATLTLVGAMPSTQEGVFAGTGTVDLTADIATVNRNAISTTDLFGVLSTALPAAEHYQPRRGLHRAQRPIQFCAHSGRDRQPEQFH